MALDQLVNAGLLEPVQNGRYRLHDLVRLVAAERAVEEEDPELCVKAVERALTYYAVAIRRADRLLRPGRMVAIGEDLTSQIVIAHDFANSAVEAKTWVEAELRCLVTATEQACDLAGQRLAGLIGEALWDYLYRGNDWVTARRLGELILRTAQRGPDSEMAAWAHIAVGRGAADFCDWDIAVLNFEQALSIERDRGNQRGVVLALNSLGVVAELRGDATAALHHHTESLRLVRRHGMTASEGVVQHNLSAAYGVLGRWEEALQAAMLAYTSRQQIGDPVGVASTLTHLSAAHYALGNLAEAALCCTRGIELSREVGHPYCETFCLLVRSEVLLCRGSPVEARRDVETALAVARASGDRYADALALHQRSKVFAAEGDHAQAASMKADAERALARIDTRHDRLLDAVLMG